MSSQRGLPLSPVAAGVEADVGICYSCPHAAVAAAARLTIKLEKTCVHAHLGREWHAQKSQVNSVFSLHFVPAPGSPTRQALLLLLLLMSRASALTIAF